MKRKIIYISISLILIILSLYLLNSNKKVLSLSEEDKQILNVLDNNEYVTLNCKIASKDDIHYMITSKYVKYNSRNEYNLIINNNHANILFSFNCDQVIAMPYKLNKQELIANEIIKNNKAIDLACLDNINIRKIYKNIISDSFNVYDKNDTNSYIYFKDEKEEYKIACTEYQLIEKES